MAKKKIIQTYTETKTDGEYIIRKHSDNSWDVINPSGQVVSYNVYDTQVISDTIEDHCKEIDVTRYPDSLWNDIVYSVFRDRGQILDLFTVTHIIEALKLGIAEGIPRVKTVGLKLAVLYKMIENLDELCMDGFVNIKDEQTRYAMEKFRKFVQNKIDFWEKYRLVCPDTNLENSPSDKAEDSKQEIAKIQWNGTDGQLLYLFNLLKEAGYINAVQWERRNKMIKDHFVNKRGTPYTVQRIAQAESNLISNKKPGKPKKTDSLDTVVANLPNVSVDE